MKSSFKNSRRHQPVRHRSLLQAVEMLEQRMLLSVVTLSNGAASAPVDGQLTLSVDSYGSFGDNFAQSAALYKPFIDGDGIEGSVIGSAIYFQPAGGLLTENSNLLNDSNNNTVSALPGGTFTSTSAGSTGSIDSAVSEFTVAGFDIILTQTVEPVPDGDGTSQLVQSYNITNVSNATYNNQPFTIVRYMQSRLFWGGTNTGQDWGALSGDNRIAVAFDDLNTDSVFERIDVSGLDASGNSIPDWADPVGITPNGATTSSSEQYYKTIVSAAGIPAADNGVVEGDTNGDLLDDFSPPEPYVGHAAVLALSDSLTIPMGGPPVTYTTTTGWGDTGAVAPVDYRKPGTWNITALTPVAPEGTNAVFQITRTDGSLGHADVSMADDTYVQPYGDITDPNAVIQEISYADNPPNPIVLLDGQTSTGVGDAVANPEIQVFSDTKIQGAQPFEVEINYPTENSILAVAAPNPTVTSFTVPASNEPAPFHFATDNAGTTQAVTTSWTEGQDALIAVERNGNDFAQPTNTGPYGNFSVQYTITGTGGSPATPGSDINGTITPSNADFYDATLGSDGVQGSASTLTQDANGNYVITGTLYFTGATSAEEAAQPQYQYIDLKTLTDNLYEGPETFAITLQSSNQLLVTTPSTFNGTILDQQSSGPVHLQFASQSVAESAGSVPIGVIRSGSTNGQVTINYTVQGGSSADDAIPGVDFTVPGATLSGDAYVGSLTFDVGSSSPADPLVIDLIGTNLAEPTKTLSITLSDSSNIVGLIGSPNVETLTITNNNTPGQVYFLGGATQSINEGPDPTTGAAYKYVTLQVTRDPADGAEGAVSVNYSTADGTAIAGTDYQAASGTLTWADGQTGPEDILVKVYDDTTDAYPRANKNFSVTLSDPMGGVALATPSSVVVTIVDDQQPGVNLSDANYTAYEKDPSTGLPGTANIVVERDLAAGETAAPWSFTYSILPGTAQPGVDYVAPTSTTVNVTDASQNTYTISIPILADDNNASDTAFTVHLTGATIGSNSSSLGSSTAATVTITNADTDVALSAATYSALPGSGMVPITIDRTGRSDAAIIVYYTTVDGTATAGTDYSATTGSVVIPAGTEQVSVDVPILTPATSTLPTRSFTFKITNAVLQDPTDDANTFTVNYSATPATVSISGQVSATSIQLQSGKGNKVNRIVVTFSDPLNASGVPNLYNYVLTTGGKNGVLNKQVGLTNAQYDPLTQSVTLYTKQTLSNNKLYQLSIRSDGSILSMSNQPFVTGAPGGLGGTQVATFSRGTKVRYTDPDGDLVTLQIKHGGSMDFIDGVDGGYPSLSVAGTTKSQLTGSLKPLGDGHTIIASIDNPDGVQDLLAENPDFSIGTA